MSGNDGLLGKVLGAVWKSGDEDGSTPAPAPTPTQAPGQQAVQSVTVPTSVVTASTDPEILESTRNAVMNIPGSMFTKFLSDLKKLENVPMDQSTRIRTVIAMNGVNASNLINAINTEHAAELTKWKASVEKARATSHSEKVGGREGQLTKLSNENAQIDQQIANLQEQKRKNEEASVVLRNEIAQAEGEIEVKSRQYDAATNMIDSELKQFVTLLQTLST